MIEQMMRVTQLYDMYKGLLTQRQQRCFELHYFQDYSFAEVGAEMGVTRQAANDIVQRAVEQMQQTEDKVGFMQKQNEVRAGLQCVQKDLRAGRHEAALDRIENMLRNEAS
jgi:uncharacterized protein